MIQDPVKSRVVALVAAAVFCLFGTAACASRQSSQSRLAPAFSVSNLATAATDDWITNGGSLTNDRYSTLSEVSASNVAGLKGVWRTRLRGSAIAAKYSAESQPLEYAGVIFVPTGMDDVFAINADTGRILWEHQAHLDQKISTIW